VATDGGVDRLEVAVGKPETTGVAVEGLSDEGRRRVPRCCELVDRLDCLCGVAVRILAAVAATEVIGGIDRVYPGGSRVCRALGLSATEVDTASER